MEYIANPTKGVKDIPKRPDAQKPTLMNMTKDELMEFAAARLIGLMATFDENLYKKDNAYQNTFNIQFMWGVAAYAMLGFRDVGFPIDKFLEEYGKSIERVNVKKRILG
jgi:hypothetical protein